MCTSFPARRRRSGIVLVCLAIQHSNNSSDESRRARPRQGTHAPVTGLRTRWRTEWTVPILPRPGPARSVPRQGPQRARLKLHSLRALERTRPPCRLSPARPAPTCPSRNGPARPVPRQGPQRARLELHSARAVERADPARHALAPRADRSTSGTFNVKRRRRGRRKRRGHIQRQLATTGLEEAPRAHSASTGNNWPGGSAAGTFSVNWQQPAWRKRRGHIQRQLVATTGLEEAPRAHADGNERTRSGRPTHSGRDTTGTGHSAGPRPARPAPTWTRGSKAARTDTNGLDTRVRRGQIGRTCGGRSRFRQVIRRGRFR